MSDRTAKKWLSLNKCAEFDMKEMWRDRGPQFATSDVHANPRRGLDSVKALHASQALPLPRVMLDEINNNGLAHWQVTLCFTVRLTWT